MPIKKPVDTSKDSNLINNGVQFPDTSVVKKRTAPKTDDAESVAPVVEQEPIKEVPATPAPLYSYQHKPNIPTEDNGSNGDSVGIEGMLEILNDYGVIRQREKSESDLPRDVYISHSQIKRFNLRKGDSIKGYARPPKEGERYLSLLRIESVEGIEPESARKRPHFTELTPIFPKDWMKLETTKDVISTRLIDLIAPIGKGQRAMLVAPPKAGKTFLLMDIANGITTNHPEIVLMVALIGERP